MSDSKRDELDRASAFVGWWASSIWNIPGTALEHPSCMMARMIESGVSLNRVLSGAKQALNDIVEASQDFNDDEVLRVDSLLREAGILTLTDARLRSSRYLNRLIKRGTIRNDSGYYVVKAALEDPAKFKPEIIQQLQRMLVEYEGSSGR